MTIRGLLGVSRNIFYNCLEENDPEEKLRETFWNISRTVLTEVQKLPRVIFSCLIPLLLQQNCLKSLPLRNPSENKEISVNSEESADELGILDYLRIWKKAHYPCAKFHYKYRNSIKYLLFQSVGIAHHAGTFSSIKLIIVQSNTHITTTTFSAEKQSPQKRTKPDRDKRQNIQQIQHI